MRTKIREREREEIDIKSYLTYFYLIFLLGIVNEENFNEDLNVQSELEVSFYLGFLKNFLVIFAFGEKIEKAWKTSELFQLTFFL